MLSDEERAAAVTALRAAAEEGRLEPASLDARVGLVRAAATREDLAAALHGVTTNASGAVRPPADLGRPGWSPTDPLNLVGGGSTARRKGRWEVPPYLRLQAVMSGVRLDFLDAVAAAPVIDVQVAPGMDTIRLWLPAGWAVDVDRLGSGLVSIKSLVPAVPEGGCPVLVLHGTLGASTLKATGPSWRERRRRGLPR